MGNTSSSITGTASLDSYIEELGDITFEKPLSSSRFLKCIRGRHVDSQVVVKLLVKAGVLNLKNANKQLNTENELLLNIPGALSYQRVLETDRAVYLVRQYIASNLYDRISTRPFLEAIEKRWIVFQLLSAVRDCHAQGIHHGDIKSENVLVTSWNWIYLTDFAFFKPTYLPENNPADFSYYFDTSFRRTCYVAPERFYATSDARTGTITEAMDIFSLGCVIAELFLEGSPLFDLSQLLRYKSGEFDPSTVVEVIEDIEVRALILHMIQLDPEKRLTAEGYLSKWQRRAFPEYFATFLSQYIGLITDPQRHHSQIPSADLDEQLDRIFFEFDKISFFLGFDPGETEETWRLRKAGLPTTSLSIPNYQRVVIDNATRAQGEDGALIFLSLLLSGTRNTTRPSTRVRACDTILALTERISDEAKLDRVVPSLVALLNDEAVEVRCSALRTLCQVLSMVTVLTPVNAFIFPEYILPRLTSFTTDSSVLVRVAYAQKVALVADTATRYFEMAQALRSAGFLTLNDDTEGEVGISEEVNFKRLFELAQIDQKSYLHTHVITLLTDPDAHVKQSLLKNIAKLSKYFGRHRANDVVLSHLITYLNDRDWLLKAALFDNIVDLCSFLGQSSVQEYVVPLMVQSLADPEEFIIEKVLNALTTLYKKCLIERQIALSLLTTLVRFFLHPNLWIQEAATGYVVAVSEGLCLADVHCLVLPRLKPFLRSEIRSLDAVSILQTLRRPLGPQIWSWLLNGLSVVVQPNPKAIQTINFWPFTEDLKNPHSQKLPVLKYSEDLAFLTRLRNAGLRPEDDWKLLCLQSYIYRVSYMRLEAEKNLQSKKQDKSSVQHPVTIFFDHIDAPEAVHDNNDLQKVLKGASSQLQHTSISRDLRKVASQNSILFSGPLSMKSHTQSMSATPVVDKEVKNGQDLHKPLQLVNSTEDNVHQARKSSSAVHLPGVSSKALAATSTTPAFAVGLVEHQSKMQEVHRSGGNPQKHVLAQGSHTYRGSDEVVLRMLDKSYMKTLPQVSQDFGPTVAPTPPTIHETLDTYSWQPQGILVAHIHEHTAAINCVKVSPDSLFFVTASDDGTVKVWDSGKLVSNVANRSRLTYRGFVGTRVKCMTFMENSHSIVACSDAGSIHIIKITCTRNTSSITKLGSTTAIRKLQLPDEEIALQLEHFVQEQASILLVATNQCRILAYDVSTMTLMYSLQNPVEHGTLTCFCLDKKKSWLLLGTSRGILDLWDLRFKLRLKAIGIPNCSRISNVLLHPSRGRGRWVCVMSSTSTEVTVWDLEKSLCREVYKLGSSENVRPQDYISWDVDETKSEELLALYTKELSLKVPNAHTRHGRISAATLGTLFTHRRPNTTYLLVADSSQSIRCCDMTKVEQSFTICGPQSGEPISYRSKNVNSMMVFEEVENKTTNRASKKTSKAQILATQQNTLLRDHMDTILDVAFLQWPYNMVISVDRSGVLKVFA